MLRYLGLGTRPLGDYPMPAHRRVNWEFLAVVRGRLAPFFQSAHQARLASDALWLFPPGFIHGWVGEPAKKCEVVVIHFHAVPEAVARCARERGYLAVRLRPADKRFLRQLGKNLKIHYWQPTLESDIHTQRALMDLSLLILRDYSERRQPLRRGLSAGKVAAAETWLREHLADRPSIADAARVTGVSASQLNRLFRKVRKESPQSVLNRLRLDRAMEIMANSGAKLHAVAAECGFSSASNLCRAFREYRGHSPTTWRKETFIQHKVPSRAAQKDHTAHGRRYREAF